MFFRFQRLLPLIQSSVNLQGLSNQWRTFNLFSIETLYVSPIFGPTFTSLIPKTSYRYLSSYSGDEDFSGHIPIDRVEISYMRSGGPGGQNVNKVNSKVEIRFHVESADWIPEWIREEIIKKEQPRINKSGYLIVTSESTRTQYVNQEDCINKLRTIIFNNARKPYEPTEEEIQIKAKRIAKVKRKILDEKRQKSLKKQNRSKPSYHDL